MRDGETMAKRAQGASSDRHQVARGNYFLVAIFCSAVLTGSFRSAGSAFAWASIIVRIVVSAVRWPSVHIRRFAVLDRIFIGRELGAYLLMSMERRAYDDRQDKHNATSHMFSPVMKMFRCPWDAGCLKILPYWSKPSSKMEYLPA